MAAIRSTKSRRAVVLSLSSIEQERDRIALDLHDSIGSMLSTALLLFDTIEATNHDRMESVRQLLQDTQHEVRRIAHAMMPSALSKFGLTSAIEQALSKLSAQIQIQSHIENIETEISADAHVHIYRIIQELLSNTIRHARANAMRVEVVSRATHIYICVSDNGNGFDQSLAKQICTTIVTRVEALQGSVNIRSRVGEGTMTEIQIPKSASLLRIG